MKINQKKKENKERTCWLVDLSPGKYIYLKLEGKKTCKKWNNKDYNGDNNNDKRWNIKGEVIIRIARVGYMLTEIKKKKRKVNHMIYECSKLLQKEYTSRYDRVGKVTHWKSRTTFKFDHVVKWYLRKTQSVYKKMNLIKLSETLKSKRIPKSRSDN